MVHQNSPGPWPVWKLVLELIVRHRQDKVNPRFENAIVSWDEIIFRTTNVRDRLIMERMARGGMRVGEVLKLTVNDIQNRKLVIRDPKSGKEREYIFIPQKVADKLKEYIRENEIAGNQRICSIGYEAARAMVRKAGMIVGIRLRPHDLRRHAASFASRSGVPIEIISTPIFRPHRCI